MSNIDKRALREAAEKATPGVWVYLPKNTSIEYDYGSDDSQGSVTYMDSGDFTQKQTDLNGDFIAAANPSTVLALLDELEAVQKVSAARLVAIDTTHKMFQRERDRAEAAEKLIAEQRETLLAARSHVMQCARLGDGHASGVLQAIDRAAGKGGEHG